MSNSTACEVGPDSLERLVTECHVPVELRPCSGLDLADDSWTASFPPFDVRFTDLGTDAALIGLTGLLRQELRDRLADPRLGDDPRLLMRLWLAERDGELGSLLSRSARRFGWSYEEMCAAERG